VSLAARAAVRGTQAGDASRAAGGFAKAEGLCAAAAKR
jgi:hypothetical protein